MDTARRESQTGASPVGADTMSPALRTARNYYAWIAMQFRSVLGRRVLDIGGGFGPHLDHVVDPSRFVLSLDLSAECVRALRTRFPVPHFEARVGDMTDPDVVRELGAYGLDTILCINVLEHIERDDTALRAMAEILRPARGRLFLLVPAHPFLFGSPDTLAGHFRRYTRRHLVALLGAAGFAVRRVYFFNSFGALPYLINARVLRPKTLGGSVDTQIVLFDRYLVPVLRRIEPLLRLPFGQSLIAIAEFGGTA